MLPPPANEADLAVNFAAHPGSGSACRGANTRFTASWEVRRDPLEVRQAGSQGVTDERWSTGHAVARKARRHATGVPEARLRDDSARAGRHAMCTSPDMDHLSCRTTYLSLEAFVEAIAALHDETAGACAGQPDATELRSMVSDCHRRVAEDLRSSLAGQNDTILGLHLQYTGLRELESQLEIDRQEKGPGFITSTLFARVQAMLERLAGSLESEDAAEFLARCAELEATVSKRLSMAQQHDMAYPTTF